MDWGPDHTPASCSTRNPFDAAAAPPGASRAHTAWHPGPRAGELGRLPRARGRECPLLSSLSLPSAYQVTTLATSADLPWAGVEAWSLPCVPALRPRQPRLRAHQSAVPRGATARPHRLVPATVGSPGTQHVRSGGRICPTSARPRVCAHERMCACACVPTCLLLTDVQVTEGRAAFQQVLREQLNAHGAKSSPCGRSRPLFQINPRWTTGFTVMYKLHKFEGGK